jgi:DNA-directed RNA polymerase I and III subunit RPAC1
LSVCICFLLLLIFLLILLLLFDLLLNLLLNLLPDSSSNTPLLNYIQVLSHRIGLIPIKVDPSKLDFVENDEETDNDTLVFNFEVECKNETTGKTNRNGEPIYVNEHALSSSLIWIPEGNQREMFPEGIAPVHDDIVIAKLKPGQRIEFEAHCVKGVGKDHAKFSPVATASYRLLPEITFAEPITGDRAQELKSMCPQNVFDIEDMEAVVARPRECTMCRECIRKDGWHDSVQLKRKADTFLFTIESTGCMPTETIVREAIKILKQKSIKFQTEVEKFEQSQI